MHAPLVVRSGAVALALALGIACVPELTEGAAPAAAAVGLADVGATAVSLVPTTDQVPAAAAFDEELLPRDATGAQVLEQHADLVPKIAALNEMPAHELARLLQDDTLRVSTAGHTYVVDPAAGPGPSDVEPQAEQATAASTGDAGAAPVMGSPYAKSKTLSLESQPGAARTIYIDVDGARVANTFWNDPKRENTKTKTTPLPNGTYDGVVPAGAAATDMSDAQAAWVRAVWREVAEAYAPFDVNVTTRDLGSDAILKTSAADPTWGTHVVVTDSQRVRDAVCGGGCAGTAIKGYFGAEDPRGTLTPAWVFAALTDMTASQVAQNVSHEVGHTLGLSHDSVPDKAYTFGTELWGPIMGGAYNRAVSHWSKGDYTNATAPNGKLPDEKNPLEDDLAEIAKRIPLVADDHGDTSESATRVTATGNTYDVEGLISTRADVDAFRLDVTCPGRLSATAAGIGRNAALDTSLQLLDSTGTQVAIGADDTRAVWDAVAKEFYSTGMGASVAATVERGAYYLLVFGVGQGTTDEVRSMNGYNDYGSLGRYRLTATSCGATDTPTPGPTPTDEPTTVPVRTVPGAPTIGKASSGAPRGRSTVTARWKAPVNIGNSALTGYKITAYKLNARGAVVRTYRTGTMSARGGTAQVGLPKGRYRLAVQALNAVGGSKLSGRSAVVTAR